MLVRNIPETKSFKDAWKRYPLQEYFVGKDDMIYEVERSFRGARLSRKNNLDQPLPPTRSIDVACFFKSIDAETFRLSKHLVRSFSVDITFKKALFIYALDLYFTDTKKTIEDIKELYIKTRLKGAVIALPKREDSGLYKVYFSILDREFNDALCDSVATINVMSMERAKTLELNNLKISTVCIGLANAEVMQSYGVAEDVMVWIRNCGIPADFHVIDMREDDHTPFILGGPFLTTLRAVIVWLK